MDYHELETAIHAMDVGTEKADALRILCNIIHEYNDKHTRRDRALVLALRGNANSSCTQHCEEQYNETKNI